jgi:calcium binding protein
LVASDAVKPPARARSRRKARRVGLSTSRLSEMIEEATVDAYGESEQVVGFFTMIDERLAVPFETTLLGLPVTVKGVDLTERDQIVAICTRGRLRQPIPILDLMLPSPSPTGAEWIEAYRYWVGRV